jgi:acetyl esterase/lipase
VVVILHGGYWRASYGAELGQPLAADLSARGFATFNVEYRRVGNGGGWPQTGADVGSAVDALATDGQRLAGGQLAAWLISRRGAAVPLTGAVLQAGVLDLVRGFKTGLGGGAVGDFLGGSPADVPQAYAQASPTALVPLGVPSICVHGTADTTVPLDQSERFVAAASAAGDQTELQTFDGDHFDPITTGTEAWDLCVAAVTRLSGRS